MRLQVLDQPAVGSATSLAHDNFPRIEPDGTSTSNPALFPGTIFTDTFDNFYVGVARLGAQPASCMPTSRSASSTTARNGCGAGTQLRHSFGASNFQSQLQLPEIPDSAAARQRLRRLPVEQRRPSSTTSCATRSRATSPTTPTVGPAHDQGRLAVRADRQRPARRRAVSRRSPQLGTARAALDGRRVQRHLRALHGDARLQLGRHPHQRRRPLPAGRVDGRPNLTLNLGVRTDKEEIPSYTRGQPRHQVRLRRQDLAARRLRVGHPRQRQVEGLRQLGHLLRHLEARDAARPVRLRALGHLLLHARHVQLAVDPVRPSAGRRSELPGHVHRAGRLPPCRERRGQLPDRSEPQADSDARVHARPRSRAEPDDLAVGVRYARKRFDRTIEDTGVLVPGIGEVYRITNPGEGIGENVLRDYAGCTTCPNQPKPTRNYDGLEFRLRKRLSNNWSLTTTLSLQPALRQLLRPDQLRREQPQLAERQPLLRRPVQLVRSPRPARSSDRCRPTARTSSRCRAPTTCRGGPASASTGSPRAARRCRRR